MSSHLRSLVPFSLVAAAFLVIDASGGAIFAQQPSPPRPLTPIQSKPAPTPPAPRAAAPKPAARPAAARPAAPKPVAAVAPGGAQPALLGQYGDWGAYKAAPGGKLVCFAITKPTSSSTNPPNRPRDPAYLFVSSRPAERVKDEVSVIIGYPFKGGSETAAVIGQANFGMYTQNDGAWIKNAAEEARMVEAMRKGADVVIKGESTRGTKTTDVFSLKGLSQALDRVAQDCQ